jgi:hypothetical protein
VRCKNRGPPYAMAGGTFRPSVSRLPANPAAPLYKASPQQPRARCGFTASLLPSCPRVADQVASLACPRAMAKNGLVLCILVVSLLLDQTDGYPSRMKARKHSKRRVKGNGTLLPRKTLGFLRVGKVLGQGSHPNCTRGPSYHSGWVYGFARDPVTFGASGEFAI